jgi:flap endonuclease-1
MGIKNFSDFIKIHAPNCYFEIPLESFRGRRFAIDINNLAFQMMGIAIKEVIDQTNIAEERPDRNEINRRALDKIIERIGVFLRYGIVPVCVFDGKAHRLKIHAKKKRKGNTDRVRQKLAEAETRLYSADPLFRTQALVNEYVKYFKQINEVSYEFMEQLRNLLNTVGFPTFNAMEFGLETNDAEGICAALCLGGNDYCYAAVTNDSDFHAYGGNIQIIDVYPRSEMVNGVRSSVYFAKVRSLEAILQQSKLTFEQFRDLCILHGTDFNPNIPNIGPARAWDRIQQYGSIAVMSQYVDVSPLNYLEVLKIFSSTIVKINIPPPDINMELFRANSRNTFDIHGLRDHASMFAYYLNQKEGTQTETLTTILTKAY